MSGVPRNIRERIGDPTIRMTTCPQCGTLQRTDSRCGICGSPVPEVLPVEACYQCRRIKLVDCRCPECG